MKAGQGLKGKEGGGEDKGDEGQARGSGCCSGLGGGRGCRRGVKDLEGQGRAQPR